MHFRDTAVDVYWEFYDRLWNYVHEEENSQKLDDLWIFYEDNKAMLNKAFGRGQNLFHSKKETGCFFRLPKNSIRKSLLYIPMNICTSSFHYQRFWIRSENIRIQPREYLKLLV